ncbi:MAG: alpha/beta fold hydrolase [Kiritimatiellia bacterium]|nr:alpha/beta fold hydrolase [Kiritimatiellia bacterium]
MHVEQYGEGSRTFLAIHGWGGTHRDFIPLARRMPEDARLLAVDLPGYGQSPAPEEWDFSAITAELVRILIDRELTGVTLIGFCSGALLALMAAEMAPERVARVVLIDPFAYLPWYFRLFTLGLPGRLLYRMTFASSIGRRIATTILRRKQRTDDNFLGAFEKVDHGAALKWLKLFGDLGREDRIAKTRLPVDIAQGERTFAAVHASVRQYRRWLPQARVTVLRDSGHLPLVRGVKQLAKLLF